MPQVCFFIIFFVFFFFFFFFLFSLHLFHSRLPFALNFANLAALGPEIVRPCPALSICSWVPNLFAPPPSLVRDGVESLCPKDPKFLPTIPAEYKALLQGGKVT